MTGLPFSLAYTRTRLSASTFPMFATNTPYPESQSYAIPLGKNCPQRGGAPCGLTLHMISQRRRTTSFTLGRMCVSEKAGFFLIKTHKYRGLLLELLRETTRPQHPYRGGLSSRPEATRIPVFISWSGSLPKILHLRRLISDREGPSLLL